MKLPVRSACAFVASIFLLSGFALGQDAAAPASPPPLPPVELPGMNWDEDFFPGAAVDPAVPTPDSVLGFKLGMQPATHKQILDVVSAIAAASPRVRVFDYGTTHEGRQLIYAVIAAPERLDRIAELKADYARLADPRRTTPPEADELIRRTPAMAWMAYCIHGDEPSGSDAALAVLHQLAAGSSPEVLRLLDDLVIVIDPLMNPDGRDRWITDIIENRTRQPQVDHQSLLHTGVWPSGRMNHYLFDLNRDWIFATQPETRGRLEAIRDWHPHYFMESHEMGPLDTFLFLPPREPINPHYPPHARKWERIFADEHGQAFDARGWRYYTGEWNEGWYPGYSSLWAVLRGAIENLYEQATINIDAVRRPEGTLESYRESVHKQVVSTMANLRTLAANRSAVLTDFVADRRAVLADQSPYATRAFAVVPGPNTRRLESLLDLLRIQGIEHLRASRNFSAPATDRLGVKEPSREFPAGTILVPTRQPLARLASTLLEFDPRMSAEFLTIERRELLRFDRSKLYDITGWSVPMLYDLQCYELEGGVPANAEARALEPAPQIPPDNAVAEPQSTVAFLIDGADDRAVAAAARLMERGVRVRASDKPIEFDGVAAARGSLLITRKDNQNFTGELAQTVRDVCTAIGASARGLRTGMGPGDLPDLGGEHFVLLHPPSAAVLGREPASPYSFGQLWWVLDHAYGVRASYVSFDALNGADLRHYNVIVIPEAPPEELSKLIPGLKAWTEGGGTLIVIGSSCEAFAHEKGIGSARLLSDVVAKPEPYLQAIIREHQGLNQSVEGTLGYDHAAPAGERTVEFPWDGAASEKPSEDELKRRDEWRKIFMPQGAILAARVDDRSWLTAGCGAYLPVVMDNGPVLMTTAGLAPVRFGVFAPAPAPAPVPEQEKAPADASPGAAPGTDPDSKKTPAKPKPGWTVAPPGMELRLRMSGLLWPEAAERLANTAYLVREQVGNGQIIMFASDPGFRAASLGTSRVFANAVVFGPGMGASQSWKP